MKIVEKRPAIERFDGIVNRWKEQLIQGQTDTNELVFRLRDFVQTEFDINRIKSNRWIPCSERLPENRERVLVCFRSGTVHIAVWYGDYDEKGAWKVTSQFPTKLYRTYTIPKWMPTPDAYEPPKGEQK